MQKKIFIKKILNLRKTLEFIDKIMEWYANSNSSKGWNVTIVALEKRTWFHFRLIKTGFLFLLQTLY